MDNIVGYLYIQLNKNFFKCFFLLRRKEKKMKISFYVIVRKMMEYRISFCSSSFSTTFKVFMIEKVNRPFDLFQMHKNYFHFLFQNCMHLTVKRKSNVDKYFHGCDLIACLYILSYVNNNRIIGFMFKSLSDPLIFILLEYLICMWNRVNLILNNYV